MEFENERTYTMEYLDGIILLGSEIVETDDTDIGGGRDVNDMRGCL